MVAWQTHLKVGQTAILASLGMIAENTATAWAILNVPFANGATSNTPIGPFQTIVRAREISSEKASIVVGPISRPIISGGIGCPLLTTCTRALTSTLLATTWSTGKRN